jgi:hypothetical protein
MNEETIQTYTCIECGKSVSGPMSEPPDELIDWYDAGDSGCICFECRVKHIPDLTGRDAAILGVAVMELLKEVENALIALRENGCPQHAAELDAKTSPVWSALDPILGDGPRMVEWVAEHGMDA